MQASHQPEWHDYQASWSALMQHLSEVYVQEISDKRCVLVATLPYAL